MKKVIAKYLIIAFALSFVVLLSATTLDSQTVIVSPWAVEGS